MNAEGVRTRDYRYRVVAYYRARAGESLERARQALEAGEVKVVGLHLDEAQAWAQFAASWARTAFVTESSQTSDVGGTNHG